MSQSPTADAERLRNVADALERDAVEIESARQREAEPRYLWQQAVRAAIHAMRQLLVAKAAGAELFGPLVPEGLDPKDDTVNLLGYWQLFAMPWLRSKCPDERAGYDAGSYDFPPFKTDKKGRILGADGKPIRLLSARTNKPLSAADCREFERIRRPGADTEEIIRVMRRIGPIKTSEPARVTDDLDDAGKLNHLRAQCRDWADACRAAARLIREQASTAPAVGASPSPIPKRRTARRRATARAPRPLTAAQTEAMQLVGEHKGNITAAARAAGKSRPAMAKLYKKATAKLGKKAIKHFTQRLPKDNRGQETIAAAEEK